MGKQNDMYVQCELQRVNGAIDVAWIPEKFATRGKFVKIRNSDGNWENGWEVKKTYAKQKFSEIELKEMDYKRQRKASDV